MEIFGALFCLLPLLFLLWLAQLFAKNKRTGLVPALACFVLPFALWIWEIPDEAGNTMGPSAGSLDLFFVPLCALVAGGFGLGFGRLRSSAVIAYRILAYIFLTAAIAPIALLAYEILNGWPSFFVKGIITAK